MTSDEIMLLEYRKSLAEKELRIAKLENTLASLKRECLYLKRKIRELELPRLI